MFPQCLALSHMRSREKLQNSEVLSFLSLSEVEGCFFGCVFFYFLQGVGKEMCHVFKESEFACGCIFVVVRQVPALQHRPARVEIL